MPLWGPAATGVTARLPGEPKARQRVPIRELTIRRNRLSGERDGASERPRPLGPGGCARYRASTPGLSRSWSTTGLTSLCCGRRHLEAGFALRCCQRFSVPDDGFPAMPLAGQPAHRRSVRPGPLVLGATPLTPPAPAMDRDRTVSRRSEPSSRAALMGEQPNPWDRLRPQDATSRHRGAKPCRRCELLGRISLLSPG